jgi:dolichol kinase
MSLIGDGFSGLIGFKYGTIKLKNNRTLEGTIARNNSFFCWRNY